MYRYNDAPATTQLFGKHSINSINFWMYLCFFFIILFIQSWVISHRHFFIFCYRLKNVGVVWSVPLTWNGWRRLLLSQHLIPFSAYLCWCACALFLFSCSTICRRLLLIACVRCRRISVCAFVPFSSFRWNFSIVHLANFFFLFSCIEYHETIFYVFL